MLSRKEYDTMMRFTSGLMGGIAVGLIIGASATVASDEKSRRKMIKTSKRALKNAGEVFDDIF